MKKLLLSASALALMSSVAMAADLAPAPVEPVAVIAPFSWTGFYVGANVGYGWGSSSVDIAGLGKIGDWSSDGAVGGIQAGYNYQINQFVLGAEIDADISGVSGTNNAALIGLGTKTDLRWFGTGRLRAGYAYDRALFFVAGGVAVGDVKNTLFAPGFSFSQSDTNWGWTLGAGIEYAFTDNWSAKLEYRYIDLGDNNQTIPLGGGARLNYKNQFNVVNVGVNYRF